MRDKKIFFCFFLSSFLLPIPFQRVMASGHKITVLGAGYVGLITAACCADIGNQVYCVDTDADKIALLNHHQIPIYEHGLEELVARNIHENRLYFTTNFDYAIAWADTIFIAVGTPMSSNGCADLTAVYKALEMIAPHLHAHKYICVKSTVPVGTCNDLNTILLHKGVSSSCYDIISNPEFLREGTAIRDFMLPDRIVVGASNPLIHEHMQNLYRPLGNVPYLATSWSTSELIKYASNAFLATKVSFINEIANLCDQTGADVQDVALGMGLDKRIGQAFLKPGPGFGGSCFPKDCAALEYMALAKGVGLHIVKAALLANENQKLKPLEKLVGLIGNDLAHKKIALLGLAFKAETDDIRYSPALTVIEHLHKAGAHIHVYDPVAMNNMKKIWPDIHYCSCAYEAATNADAIIILTEWPEFKALDFKKVAELMRFPVLIDTRNIVSPALLKAYSFSYACMGRS